MNEVQTKLIDAGVRNLKEFGYPDCNPQNILTDYIYSKMFLSMLEENLGQGFDKDIKALIAVVKPEEKR
jgi:hypothetical protein